MLAYIHEPGLPPSLREVPIEALAAGYRAFAASSAVTPDRIVVLAASVATGGALAMLAYTADIDPRGLVAISPTHVVWQALGTAAPHQKHRRGGSLVRHFRGRGCAGSTSYLR